MDAYDLAIGKTEQAAEKYLILAAVRRTRSPSGRSSGLSFRI
jgi:hypothetical protein